MVTATADFCFFIQSIPRGFCSRQGTAIWWKDRALRGAWIPNSDRGHPAACGIWKSPAPAGTAANQRRRNCLCPELNRRRHSNQAGKRPPAGKGKWRTVDVKSPLDTTPGQEERTGCCPARVRNRPRLQQCLLCRLNQSSCSKWKEQRKNRFSSRHTCLIAELRAQVSSVVARGGYVRRFLPLQGLRRH